MDSRNRHGELSDCRVVVLPLRGLFEPFNSVVKLRRLAFVLPQGKLLFAPTLQDWSNDLARLPNLRPRLLTGGEEPMYDAASESWPHAQLLGCRKPSYGVLLGDLEPLLVATEFLAQEDPRRDTSYKLENRLA